MKKWLSLCALVLLTCVVAPLVSAQTLGLPPDPGGGNCFPFGCAYTGLYQQVYSSTQFSTPIEITGLEFFNTTSNSGATSTPSGTFTIGLSTTSANWNTLSSTFSSNLGADNTVVFNGSVSQPWTFGDTLSITLSTPFNYNPGAGNLLMTVNVNGSTTPGGLIFFDTNGGISPNNYFGRVYITSGEGPALSGNVDNGFGLVTGFETTPLAPTPEPSTFASMAIGVLGIGILLRRLQGSS